MDDRDFSNPSTHRQQFSLVRGCLRFQVYTHTYIYIYTVYIYICTSLTGNIPNIFVVEHWNHPFFRNKYSFAPSTPWKINGWNLEITK